MSLHAIDAYSLRLCTALQLLLFEWLHKYSVYLKFAWFSAENLINRISNILGLRDHVFQHRLLQISALYTFMNYCEQSQDPR